MTVTQDIRVQMRRLVLREHMAIETVARRFGVHHSVVRRAIRDESEKQPREHQSALDPYKPYIVKRLGELPKLSCVRLLEELREKGYQERCDNNPGEAGSKGC